MKDNTLILDAIAEHALACYYREARVPVAAQSEDDAHALLSGYNREADCWVANAEADGYNMGDTRSACMVWKAMVDDFIGFTSAEVATIYAEIADMTADPAALAALQESAESERDTWHAIANRPDSDADDADTLDAWEDTTEVIADRMGEAHQ